MSDITDYAKSKAEELTSVVTSDSRWMLEDELMCQVFGYTLWGYVFGIGRTFCFMDVEDIQELAADQLRGLGIGAQYAEGMMQAAHSEFMRNAKDSVQNTLIGIGHSHIASVDLTQLVDSVFQNADQLRESLDKNR